MKTLRNLSIAGLIFLVSSCIVVSFHPLYTADDLFANDLLLGQWMDREDSTIWQFTYAYNGEEVPENVDSTAYILKFSGKENKLSENSFKVHVVELDGQYFVDFYLENYRPSEGKDPDLFDLHLMPVHSFARLQLSEDEAAINWFNPDWLTRLAERKKLEVDYEEDDGMYLITAPTPRLQKFVVKHYQDEEAFEDGLSCRLTKLE